MDPHVFRRRLHYASAVACGVFATLIAYIICTMLGIDLNQMLPHAEAGPQRQLEAAMAWWGIAGAGFIAAWAAQAYLVAAARERDFIYRLALRFLIVLVFAATAAAGLLSKSGRIDGTANVIDGLIALGLGFICANCGARLAYLNTDQA